MKKVQLKRASVLVYGGRQYNNWEFAKLYLDQLPWTLKVMKLPYIIDEVVNGGASGADQLARRWATLNRIPIVRFDADWTKYGKAAGPLRNQQTADYQPTIGVAFPGGKGTKDMTAKLVAKGILVFIADEVLIPHLKRMKRLYDETKTLSRTKKVPTRTRH